MVDKPKHSVSETRKERKEKRRGKLPNEQEQTQVEPKRATRAIKKRSNSSKLANSDINNEQSKQETTTRAERKQAKKQTFGEWVAAKREAFKKWNEDRKYNKESDDKSTTQANDAGKTKVYSKESLTANESRNSRNQQRDKTFEEENEVTTKKWEREEAAAALVGEKETKPMKRTATKTEKQTTREKRRQQSDAKAKTKQTNQTDEAEDKTLTKKEKKAEKKAKKKEKRKFLSWWMIILLLLVFAILALVAGAIIGYSLGGGDPLDALKVETWKRFYDLVNRP